MDTNATICVELSLEIKVAKGAIQVLCNAEGGGGGGGGGWVSDFQKKTLRST